jgi:hypothetical protein
MKMNNSVKTLRMMAIALVSGSLILTGCKKDHDDDAKGNTTIKVTDAAIDDAAVTGAFVTIADIKVNGESVKGFSKTTVDLHAYQNGSTKTIGSFNLDSKTYSSITFVLDYDKDASGNAPGCYVVTTGGTKHALTSTSTEITVNKSFTVDGNANTSLVADFDLRKMIIRASNNVSDKFDFATSAELQNSVRVVAESNAGIISGKISDNVSGSTKIIAYAYKKGTYNILTELIPQGSSNIYFKNAVSSSVVSGSGDYQLHFLESGNYEIHYAGYKDTNNDGEFELTSSLTISGANNIDFGNLSLGASITLTANATVTGTTPM